MESDHLPRGSLEEAFGQVCDEPLIPLQGDGPTSATETKSTDVNGTLETNSHSDSTQCVSVFVYNRGFNVLVWTISLEEMITIVYKIGCP